MIKTESKMTALVIDDNPITFMILEEMLDMIDFSVEYAEDGRTGIRFIQKKRFDIVFLDYKMPGINGETVHKIISRSEKTIPIVMISGNLTRDIVVRLKMNGVKGFLAKPFDSETLFKRLSDIFNTRFIPRAII